VFGSEDDGKVILGDIDELEGNADLRGHLQRVVRDGSVRPPHPAVMTGHAKTCEDMKAVDFRSRVTDGETRERGVETA